MTGKNGDHGGRMERLTTILEDGKGCYYAVKLNGGHHVGKI